LFWQIHIQSGSFLIYSTVQRFWVVTLKSFIWQGCIQWHPTLYFYFSCLLWNKWVATGNLQWLLKRQIKIFELETISALLWPTAYPKAYWVLCNARNWVRVKTTEALICFWGRRLTFFLDRHVTSCFTEPFSSLALRRGGKQRQRAIVLVLFLQELV